MPVKTSKRLMRSFRFASAEGRLSQCDRLVSATWFFAQLLDSMRRLPEKQVRRDRRPEYRDQQREICRAEMKGGFTVWIKTLDQFGCATTMTARYASSARQSSLKTRAIRWNEPPIMSPVTSPPAIKAHTHVGPACKSVIPDPTASKSAVMFRVFATINTAINTPRMIRRLPGEFRRRKLAEASPGRKCGPVADLLYRSHQRKGDQRGPKQAVAKLRARLGVRRDPGRIVIRRPRDEPWAKCTQIHAPRRTVCVRITGQIWTDIPAQQIRKPNIMLGNAEDWR